MLSLLNLLAYMLDLLILIYSTDILNLLSFLIRSLHQLTDTVKDFDSKCPQTSAAWLKNGGELKKNKKHFGYISNGTNGIAT